MTIRENLALTAELCGAEFSEAAARLLVAELEQYEPEAVHGALARCRREVHGRLTLAGIIERLDDGRPGPEEAWAMLPKDEAESAVISGEMGRAMGPALRLLANGDHVAARVAFLEAYKREVSQSRAEHRPVGWFPTLGHDASGRAGVLIDAVKLGRISESQAISCAGNYADQVIAGISGGFTPELGGPARRLIGEGAPRLTARVK